MAKFITQEGEVEIIRAVKKHGSHDQKTHAGGRGGSSSGSVVTYDKAKDDKILKDIEALRDEQRKLEAKHNKLSPRAVASGYSAEDEKKWNDLEKKQNDLYQQRADLDQEFFDEAIAMKSGNSASGSDFGFEDERFEAIRDEYVVPDELTLKTNAGLRRTGRVTTKVQRFDSMVEQGEVQNPTRVYRAAILSPEQTGKITEGSSFVDRGFQSVAMDRGGAESYMDIRANNISGEKVLFEYTLQPGLNAVNVGYGEIVVQRSAMVAITGVAKKGDVTIVQAEVSKP